MDNSLFYFSRKIGLDSMAIAVSKPIQSNSVLFGFSNHGPLAC